MTRHAVPAESWLRRSQRKTRSGRQHGSRQECRGRLPMWTVEQRYVRRIPRGRLHSGSAQDRRGLAYTHRTARQHARPSIGRSCPRRLQRLDRTAGVPQCKPATSRRRQATGRGCSAPQASAEQCSLVSKFPTSTHLLSPLGKHHVGRMLEVEPRDLLGKSDRPIRDNPGDSRHWNRRAGSVPGTGELRRAAAHSTLAA